MSGKFLQTLSADTFSVDLKIFRTLIDFSVTSITSDKYFFFHFFIPPCFTRSLPLSFPFMLLFFRNNSIFLLSGTVACAHTAASVKRNSVQATFLSPDFSLRDPFGSSTPAGSSFPSFHRSGTFLFPSFICRKCEILNDSHLFNKCSHIFMIHLRFRWHTEIMVRNTPTNNISFSFSLSPFLFSARRAKPKSASLFLYLYS